MAKHRRYEYLVVSFVLVILLAVFFYDVAFLKKTFKVTTANSQTMVYGVYGQKENRPKFIPVNGTDASVLEEPNLEFIKNNLQKGILPLWNPHQACGFPLIGMLETGIFFPLNLILYLLPQLLAWDILIFARFFFGGLFTYYFMRTLKFKAIPSLISAICFMLTGPMVLLQYWFVNVEIIAPLLLAAIERLVRNLTRGNIAFVAGCVALTFFGGHPEHIFFVNVVGFLYFCFRFFTLRPRPRVKSFYSLGAAYILGIGLSAIVLWPFLRNFHSEFWSTHPPHVGLTTGETINRFMTVMIPHFFQREALTYDFTFAGWWGGYIGILPIVLAVISLFRKQKYGLNYFFAALAFIIIAKAYSVPVINWIGYLPIFNICRFYIHTPHLFALTIAICAGMGARVILTRPKIFLKGLWVSLAVAAIITAHLLFFRRADHFAISLRAGIFSLGVLAAFQLMLFLKDKRILARKYLAVALVIIVGLELFLYIHRERPRRFDSFPKTPYLEVLKTIQDRNRAYGLFWVLYPNTASGYQMDDLGIYFSLLPKRYVHFVNNFLAKDFFASGLRPPALRVRPLTEGFEYLDLLNLTYWITPSALLPKTNTFAQTIGLDKSSELIYSFEVNVYRRNSAFPRVFIVHRAILTPDFDEQISALKKIKSHLKTIAVIEAESDPSLQQQLAAAPATSDSNAHIASYSPNEVIVEADMTHAGFLILGDAFHPDWKATVDGKSSRVFAADYMLRAVFLTPGNHTVRFVFQPLSFYGGALISGIFFCILVFLLQSAIKKPRT